MDARTLVDELLELTVIGSFTTVGYRLRRAMYRWPQPPRWPMAGRTVVITGPTSGLGREAAAGLAAMGARLVLVGRDAGRLDAVRASLPAPADGAHRAVVADMASLAAVRAAAAEIVAAQPRIDVLIDNAGTMIPTRELTDEGHERTFATMVLGPFVMASRLLPALAVASEASPAARAGVGAAGHAASPSRIVAVTSGGMYAQALPLDDLEYAHAAYDGTRAYARAKRAQVALVREWARRLAPRSVIVNAMHPGWADTPGLEASLPGFRRLVGSGLRTPAEGADTMLWLAASADATGHSGRLFLDRRARPFDRVPSTRLDPSDRRELWDRVLQLTGEPDPTTRGGGIR